MQLDHAKVARSTIIQGWYQSINNTPCQPASQHTVLGREQSLEVTPSVTHPDPCRTDVEWSLPGVC